MKQKLFELLRKKFKIKSLSHFANKQRRNLEILYYKKKITDEEFSNLFKKMGVKKGDVIFIHSSWNEFYNYQGTPESFIDLLLKLIGEEGTLVMPSYPFLRKKNSIFNLRTTPTLAGLLPEVFRTYKKVERSIDAHSVAAFGKNAKYLTEKHILSKSSWDENSPYYKLGTLNAKVFSLGLGKYHVGTIMHCVDSLLRLEHDYFGLFFTKEAQIKIKMLTGEILTKKYFTKEEDFYYNFTKKSHAGLIRKYFDKKFYKIENVSNIKITMFDAAYTINKTLELGKSGIVVYNIPNPKKYKF